MSRCWRIEADFLIGMKSILPGLVSLETVAAIHARMVELVDHMPPPIDESRDGAQHSLRSVQPTVSVTHAASCVISPGAGSVAGRVRVGINAEGVIGIADPARSSERLGGCRRAVPKAA
jgi:hypothetical protein